MMIDSFASLRVCYSDVNTTRAPGTRNLTVGSNKSGPSGCHLCRGTFCSVCRSFGLKPGLSAAVPAGWTTIGTLSASCGKATRQQLENGLLYITTLCAAACCDSSVCLLCHFGERQFDSFACFETNGPEERKGKVGNGLLNAGKNFTIS